MKLQHLSSFRVKRSDNYLSTPLFDSSHHCSSVLKIRNRVFYRVSQAINSLSYFNRKWIFNTISNINSTNIIYSFCSKLDFGPQQFKSGRSQTSFLNYYWNVQGLSLSKHPCNPFHTYGSLSELQPYYKSKANLFIILASKWSEMSKCTKCEMTI